MGSRCSLTRSHTFAGRSAHRGAVAALDAEDIVVAADLHTCWLPLLLLYAYQVAKHKTWIVS